MISAYLCLSTAHITEKDNTLLSSLKSDLDTFCAIRIVPHDYGYFIHVPNYNSDAYEEMIKELLDFGLSESFILLHKYAKVNNCMWINLDRDGETIDYLQTFEW